MSLGEAIGVQILTEVIVKVVEIGYHIIRESYLYIDGGQAMHLRLKVQVGILEAIDALMKNPSVQRRLRKIDATTYIEIMVQLHKLLRKYVKRHCKPGKEKTDLLKSSSIDELLKKWDLEKTLEKLTEKKAVGWRFLSRMKEEAAWIAWAREKDEKLISEIEFWGDRLDVFSSWIIPGMFFRGSLRDIVNCLGDRRMETISLKGLIITAQRDVAATAPESPLTMAYTQIKFIGEGYISSSYSGTAPRPRSELGGTERRQWANYMDKNGIVSRVIVEFKPGVELYDVEYQARANMVKESLNVLVQTLRIAGRRSDTFHVLYCLGWYETFDHFGLVYQLPPARSTAPCESLSNILLHHKHTLARDLENRLKLSKALAWTMLELHSADWVHRAFTPDNILLFGETREQSIQFDWGSPYVTGFHSSRSDSGISDQISHGQKVLSVRVYTHPDRQVSEYIRYQKSHDIYSLGVILLEIGRLSSFLEPDNVGKLKNLSPNQMKETFVKKAKALRSVLGQRFSNAVTTCLTGRFSEDVAQGDDYAFLSSFHDEVCEPLAEIELWLRPE